MKRLLLNHGRLGGLTRACALAVCALLVSSSSAFAQTPPAPAQPAAPRAEVSLQPSDTFIEGVKKKQATQDITLRDAIKMALQNNLEIAIEDFNEDIYEERLLGVRGYYDPQLRFTFGSNFNTSPTGSVLDAGRGVRTSERDTYFWNATMTQNVIGGGYYQAQLNSNRSNTNSAFSLLNPQYGSSMSFQFIQPLWRDYKKSLADRQLQLTNLDSKISDLQFESKVADIVRQVTDQYWQLVFAINNQEIQRQSMELAKIQYDNNRKRVEIGTLAPIEITSARAQVAAREQLAIAAEEQINTAHNNLRRMLSNDPKSPIWQVFLVPTDQPTFRDVKYDLEASIQQAIERRPEIQQYKLQVERNDVNYRFTRNEGKPRFDLGATLTSQGISGQAFKDDFIDTNGDGVPDTRGAVPDPSNPFFGGVGNLYKQIFGFDFRSYAVFATVQVPIFNRANEALLGEIKLSERQLRSRMKNLEQAVMVEVRNAYESIETNKKRVDTARIARELAQEQLDGETKRFRAGLSTNFQVLQYQRDLSNAQLEEMAALIDYQRAITALQRATYQIIDAAELSIARSTTTTTP